MSECLTAHLFLKAPRAGQVKTRLAETIGAENALQAYRAMVDRQLGQIPDDWESAIHYAPSDGLAEFRQWLGRDRTYRAQAAGGLGERLSFAVSEHFRSSSGPALLIGGDCPWLDKSLLLRAGELAKANDVIIGPSLDGGYYLIGLNRNEPNLFSNIEWSSSRVFEQSLARAKESRLAVGLLPELSDVDEGEDWARALQSFPELADS